MGTLLTPAGLFAAGTALAGVIVFGLAPYLPSLFPPAFARFVGFAAVGMSLAPLWILSEGWTLPALFGGGCLAVIVALHLMQTRRHADSDEPEA